MKRISLLLLFLAAAFGASASQTEPPLVYDNSNGQISIRANDAKSQIGTLINGIFTPSNIPDAGANISIIKKQTNALASNTVYATGTVTYNTGTYTAAVGPQPVPSALAAGQTYFVNFPSANPGSANLVVGTLPTKPLKVVNSAGTVLTLIGGEIVKGPATVYYDGTEYIYSIPNSRSVPVTTGTSLTQANFANRDTFYLPSGGETLTLPCSTTVSPNGQVFVFSVNGTITIDTAASPCTDNITKNGSASSTSQTVAQGAALAIIVTDGAGNFYVSGS